MKKATENFSRIKLNILSENINGKLIGGFSSSFSPESMSNSRLAEKNSGQCVVANNCVAGANCSRTCFGG